jgi:hypothetical protein
VALYSPDAKVSQAQDPSCAANTGDTVRTGHYSFYLRSKENSVIADQSIDSFGNGLLEFNDQRKMIQVLNNHGDWSSDLLAIQQYASCNGSEFAVLGLTEQGTGLLPYKFRINNKESST